MPVIRSQAPVSNITSEQRQRMVEQLKSELHGQQTSERPIIFEIPFERRDRIDVLVVWDAWTPFPSGERSDIILEAYRGSSVQVAQALGVTHQEALEQQILPYAVVPMVRGGESTEDDIKNAMLAEGGFLLESGKVDLRFPTMPLAEQAHKRLTDNLPKGYWSIVQSVGYIQ